MDERDGEFLMGFNNPLPRGDGEVNAGLGEEPVMDNNLGVEGSAKRGTMVGGSVMLASLVAERLRILAALNGAEPAALCSESISSYLRLITCEGRVLTQLWSGRSLPNN